MTTAQESAGQVGPVFGGVPGGVSGGIAAVIDRMGALDFGPDPHDGVRAFNGMYLETTRQVWQTIDAGGFSDRDFMVGFDVQFADLYFEALTRHTADPASAPRSWAALFDSRSRPGLDPLQFAMAGMTAHIGYDLPRALVAVTKSSGRQLSDLGIRTDYLAVNATLARTQPIVKRMLLTGVWADVDRTLGDVDDQAGVVALSTAREMAWNSAEVLWDVYGTWAQRPFEVGLDNLVAASARLILTPP